MHSCEVTQEKLVDLLFGELDADTGARLLAEVEDCAHCRGQYHTMTETLHVFNQAAESALPEESFWAGYEERLRKRMAQAIPPNAWQPDAAAAASFGLARAEYHLTMLEDEGLVRRLLRELRRVKTESELTWPEFRRDPFGFTGRSITAYGRMTREFFSQRDVALATMSAFVLMFIFLGGVFALERLRMARGSTTAANENDELQLLGMVDIPAVQEKPEDGTAGFKKGDGGGSKPQPEKAGGGGGDGREEALPASHGNLPLAQLGPQILPPNPHPSAIKNPELPVMPTLDLDPALAPDPKPGPIGDPKSTQMVPSSGPGTGGGMGTGEGGGMGSGEDGGYGPGRGGNMGGGNRHLGGGGEGGGGGGGADYDRNFSVREVTRKAVLISKPEPGFTEDARRHNVTGSVRLRLLLGANGAVSNISVVKGLPDGLTEKAISAAHQIRFTPAQKDGRNVNQWVTIEYNFNIY